MREGPEKEDREPRDKRRRGAPEEVSCCSCWGVRMSSPCLLRTAPISQPRLREVKLSLKASSRDTKTIQSSGRGASRPYSPAEKEAHVWVGVSSSSRSRSTPPVHHSQRPENRRTPRDSRQQGPEHHPESNGTLLQVPLAEAPTGVPPFSSSSSSSSSCTPRRQRTSHPHPAPVFSSSSSFSSAKSMKRARGLSYSTSNIGFNSILDGRFRQLQGTGPEIMVGVTALPFSSCVCVYAGTQQHCFLCC